MRLYLLLAALALSACGRGAPPASDPSPSASAAVPRAAPPAGAVPAERVACGADAECELSCAYGAVARAWAGEHIRQECVGGCASAGMRARCVAGRCVAFRGEARDDGCSDEAPAAPRKGRR